MSPREGLGWLPKAGIAAVAAASGTVAAVTAVWHLTQPGSYEECMLAEMRGRTQEAHHLVDQLCMRRWKEIPVYLPDGFNFILLKDGRVSIAPNKYSQDFRVTRATFRFSLKECSSSSEPDFSHYMTRTSGDLQFFEFRPPDSVKEPVCFQWKDVMGRYYR
jgi:hypothetical protein